MANYIDNKKFHQLLIDYQKTGNRKTYNEIGKMFLLIAEKRLNQLSFINYTEDRKCEMISLACLYMVRYLKNYDPIKFSNPFAYFSQYAWNAYLQVIIVNKRRDTMFTSLDLITGQDSVNTAENYNCEDDNG